MDDDDDPVVTHDTAVAYGGNCARRTLSYREKLDIVTELMKMYDGRPKKASSMCQ